MDCFQLLIKPTGPDCNLNCTYCFYRSVNSLFLRHATHRMKKRVLEELIRQYMSLKFPVSVFSWQGGEPTLCGLSFFRDVVKLQNKFGSNGQMVANAFQTNGILLDTDWCQFFDKYRFLVGLSLDGPQQIHDYYRKGRGGSGSWKSVMRAAKLLFESKVEFNVLTMVTRKSEDQARQLFYWFVEHKFKHLQFIPCLERLPNREGIAPFSTTTEGYGDFLCTLFDLWWQYREEQISIRFFDSILERIVCGRFNICVFSPTCQNYLVVEHNSTVYPCDFFVRKDRCLGSLMKIPLQEFFYSQAYEKFGGRKGMLANECQQCEWLPFCWGGCQKDRIDSQGGSNKKTFFCRSYQQFFIHAMPRLKSVARKIHTDITLSKVDN